MAIQLEMQGTTWALGTLVGSTLVLATTLGVLGPHRGTPSPVDAVVEAPLSFQAVNTAAPPVDGAGGVGEALEASGGGGGLGADAGSPGQDVYLAVGEGTEAAAVASSDRDRAYFERQLAEMRASIQRRKEKIEDLKARIAKGEEGLEGALRFQESVLEIEYETVAALLAQLAGMP